MAGKITELTDAAALDGGEQIEVVQSGNSRKVSLATVIALTGLPGVQVLASGKMDVSSGSGLVEPVLEDYTLTGLELIFVTAKTAFNPAGPVSSPTPAPSAGYDQAEAQAAMTAIEELQTGFNYLLTHFHALRATLVADGADVNLLVESLRSGDGVVEVYYLIVLTPA